MYCISLTTIYYKDGKLQEMETVFESLVKSDTYTSKRVTVHYGTLLKLPM